MAQPGFLNASLLVAAGGGLGAWARYGTGVVLGRMGASTAHFPWSTLAVNVAGSLLMGLLAGWLARHGTGGETWRLLLGVGVLGGFTTFSAFSLDTALLVERHAYGLAAGYAVGSVAASVSALFFGLSVFRGHPHLP